MKVNEEVKNPSFLLGVQITKAEIEEAYVREIINFYNIVKSKKYNNLEMHIEKNSILKSDPESKRNVKKMLKKSGRLDFSKINNESHKLWRIMTIANIKVVLELFRNIEIDLSCLNKVALNTSTINMIQSLEHEHKDNPMKYFSSKLNVADTLRCKEILQLAGLCTIKSEECNQLALGAISGIRDAYGTHCHSWIEKLAPQKKLSKGFANSRVFRSDAAEPNQITLVDISPEVRELYKKYNANKDNVVAINDDIYSALSVIEDKINNGDRNKVNLITAYRMDHRMIANVPEFFDRLKAIIDEQVSIIFTIGTGNNEDEFKGRIELINNIFDYLTKLNQSPVLIKLCKGELFDEMATSHLFGQNSVSSHFLLFCKIQSCKIS